MGCGRSTIGDVGHWDGTDPVAAVDDLIVGLTGPKDEREILRILSSVTSRELNDILAGVSVKDLIGSVDDSIFFGNSRTRFYDLLGLTRNAELTVSSRCILITAVQSRCLAVDLDTEDEDAFITRLVLGTRGRDLVDLKLVLDGGGDSYDLPHLVYACISGAKYRNSIRRHFHVEAGRLLGVATEALGISDAASVTSRQIRASEAVRSASRASSRKSAGTWQMQPAARSISSRDGLASYAAGDGDASFERPLIVMCDIDDTLYQSAGGAGEAKFPSGTVFPGILQILSELGHRTTFLTARPGILEDFTHSQLRRKMAIKNATILTGRISDLLLVPFDEEAANQGMADNKFANFNLYRDLWPEATFVWLGDSGQGDVDVGLRVMKSFPDCMSGVYIHDVAVKDKSGSLAPKTPPEKRADLAKRGVNIVDNWLDAAIGLTRAQVLDGPKLRRVAVSTVQDWRQITSKSSDSDWARGTREAREKELVRSLQEASDILAAQGLDTVSLENI